MDRNMLVFGITHGIIRKHNEVIAGMRNVEEFLDDILYGTYVLEKIFGDKTTSYQLKNMARSLVDKYCVGFACAFLHNSDDYDFDVYTIKEKLWFLMLYDDVDLGPIGNVKKELILADVKEWFRTVYMEVKWDTSEDFVETLAMMSHVKSLSNLPIDDVRDVVLQELLNKYDNTRPEWRLYWLTGNLKYIGNADIFDRRAWIFWRNAY